MHIAYLIPTIDRIGGAERQLLLQATGMANRGWRVSVVALYGKGGNAAETLSANNVSYLSLEMTNGLRDARGWNRLRRWITSAQPEILHAHLAQAALMGRGIRMVAPVRVLIDTIHSPATGSTARQAGYRVTSRIPDCVTAVSRSAASAWLNARIVDHLTAAIIPNGIDTELCRPRRDPQNHRHQKSASSAFRWLAVGRLDPVKDYVTLLNAVAMLPKSARLTICGTGPLEDALHRQAAQLSIQDRVTFLGFQNDVARLMQTHAAFVLSSRWEGLPIALMEACACELPAVFTDTEGCREVLPDSSLPIAPVGNPHALAAAMKAMMDMSDSARSALGQHTRQKIVGRFDSHSVLNQYEALYRHLLTANPQPTRFRRRAGSSLQTLICSGVAVPPPT
jgi:glycosyltransferase involved in cell wall biosynthesis